MKQIIHVNQHKIRSNRKHDQNEPVLTIKTYKDNQYGHEAILRLKDGTEVARIIYSKDKPLSCGATVWIQIDTNDIEVEVK